ncbi:MAG: hypothetical protein F9K44_09870 [Hyphomicrobiaceae bacterium]|nr:MAG: hypothetical protein F9K44_09870 [Hyphomicrobiaceae bacterium]
MRIRYLTAALLLPAAAAAHDWYPIECCHNMDCAPVERVDNSGGDMVVSSKIGTVAVPTSFARRESKDHRMHVCMRPEQSGAMRLLCIFMPPGS